MPSVVMNPVALSPQSHSPDPPNALPCEARILACTAATGAGENRDRDGRGQLADPRRFGVSGSGGFRAPVEAARDEWRFGFAEVKPQARHRPVNSRATRCLILIP